MASTKVHDEAPGIPGELRCWQMIGKRFCMLLPWPELRYEFPIAASSDKSVKGIDIFRKDGNLAARISIAEHDLTEEGLRVGFKDLKIEVRDRDLCEDLLLQFEAWYVRTGKRVRVILSYPWIDRMPVRYELGRVEAGVSAH